MSKYQLSRYYQLRIKIMGWYTGRSNIQPTEKEKSEYVMLFNLYVWNIGGQNQPERKSNGYEY